ncbi:serine carboxypeptidase S28 [Trypanosoma rangeli SC58]|uniref:Serine carboxypeptidase S28 n=1 Tax=Trypanosoma rangeli SC58 TaxID=429131 RepID=A0A061J6L3_TRYRA|nr:serine carboxypeptidase S28 [Trypanosoma rangeli SC58]
MWLFVFAYVLSFCGAHSLSPPDMVPERFSRGELFRSLSGRSKADSFEGGEYVNATPAVFRQLVNHSFSPGPTFDQRYWVDYSAWKGGDLAMLYIVGGKAGVSSPSGYPGVYGHQRNMLLFALENRYYGESLPTPLTDTEKMKRYLSVDIALDDLRSFQRFVENKLIGKKFRWLIVGGGYAGALSVWFKVKYPTAALAIWSSSGPVEAQFNFYAFDNHVKSELSLDCARAVRTAQSLFSELWEDESARLQFLDRFHIPHYFDKPGISYMLADAVAAAVQYGKKWDMCEMLIPQNKTDSLGQFFNMIHHMYGSSFTSECFYSTECLSNSSMSNEWASTGYAWIYQTCSELAYFQVGYYNSLRLPTVNTDYFVTQCRLAFGGSIYPDVFHFNSKWGGKKPKVSNVVALHGSDDPWKMCGVTKTLGPNYKAIIAQCEGCGHSGDLAFPRLNDPEALQNQREKLTFYLDTWMASKPLLYTLVLSGNFSSKALLEKETLIKAIQGDLYDFFDQTVEVYDLKNGSTGNVIIIHFAVCASRTNKERYSLALLNLRNNSSWLLATKQALFSLGIQYEIFVQFFGQVQPPIGDEGQGNEHCVRCFSWHVGFLSLVMVPCAVILHLYYKPKEKRLYL